MNGVIFFSSVCDSSFTMTSVCCIHPLAVPVHVRLRQAKREPPLVVGLLQSMIKQRNAHAFPEADFADSLKAVALSVFHLVTVAMEEFGYNTAHNCYKLFETAAIFLKDYEMILAAIEMRLVFSCVFYDGFMNSGHAHYTIHLAKEMLSCCDGEISLECIMERNASTAPHASCFLNNMEDIIAARNLDAAKYSDNKSRLPLYVISADLPTLSFDR